MKPRYLRASTILPGLALVLLTGGATFSQSPSWDDAGPHAPVNSAEDLSEVYGPPAPETSIPAEAESSAGAASTAVPSIAFDVPPDLSHPGVAVEPDEVLPVQTGADEDVTETASTDEAAEQAQPSVRVIPLPTREDPVDAPPAPSGLGESPVDVADLPDREDETGTSMDDDMVAPVPAPLSQRPPSSLTAPSTSRPVAVTPAQPAPQDDFDYLEGQWPMRLDQANALLGTGRERLDRVNRQPRRVPKPRLVSPVPGGDEILFEQDWVEVQTPNGPRLFFR